jgi:tRNA U54 and U55 pseudouridine synthase Pus10
MKVQPMYVAMHAGRLERTMPKAYWYVWKVNCNAMFSMLWPEIQALTNTDAHTHASSHGRTHACTRTHAKLGVREEAHKIML